ncbi:PXDN-like protein [Mya arenaria]|uniref:PXDN-like protein n=1 Tax=Mya arenaria TaxID=6604 RepID=A0ABY7DB13_MYAAR|nr:PXDN-like protein [Mya arenaria]
MRHCSGLVEINFAPVFPNIFKNIGTDCGGVVAAPCDPRAPYRQFDGSCNNLANPSWGMSEHEQNRVVPNDYDDRTDGEQLLCCGEDANDTNCFPVQIPLNDPRFTPGGCMSFPRSIAALGCNNVRQQRNSQTSYIDLSLIYAPNKATADTLRQNVGGDPRVDEQPGLSALHTVFLRAHNAIASGLARVNPHWNDELLYQSGGYAGDCSGRWARASLPFSTSATGTATGSSLREEIRSLGLTMAFAEQNGGM